jgi:hypothetical protein
MHSAERQRITQWRALLHTILDNMGEQETLSSELTETRKSRRKKKGIHSVIGERT